MTFWELCNVDGAALGADVKINLVLWRDVDDAVGVIEIVDRCSVLDKDFDWFDDSFGNEYCSWLMSSPDYDL